MRCTICGKPIVLVPSAAERAQKYGGKPSDYARLFTAHGECQVQKREAETLELIHRRSVRPSQAILCQTGE